MSRPTPPPPAPSPAVRVPLNGGVTSERDAAPLDGEGTGYSGPVPSPEISRPGPPSGSGGAGDAVTGAPTPFDLILRGWR